MLKASLLSSVTLAGLALAAPAVAQDAEVAVDELVVTGTRIRLQDFTSPNPVATVTGEVIERSGITNVTDLMESYPALVGSTGSQDLADAGNRGSIGLNLLNLRNLGEKRTLVLVDGRRHVASDPGTSSVDTNAIPVGLIDRVEVLTGGASAIYGADGVSGVVNFITKRNFEGVDARAQYGWSEGGGGENAFFSGLVGRNFLSDRANITLGFEYSDTKPLDPRDREFTRPGNRERLVENPADFADIDRAQWGDSDMVFARDVRYIDSAVGGGVYTNLNTATSLSGVSFYGDGTPWRDGLYAGGFSMIGGSGTQVDLFQTDLLPGIERWTGFARGAFALNDRHRLTAEVKYNNAKTQFISQPTFDYGIYVPLDNPFIPAAIRADALAAGGLGTAEGYADRPRFLADMPGPGVLVARDSFDLGNVIRDVERETVRVVLGAEGELSDHVSYNVSYVYGKSTENNRELNNRNNERWFAAIDAVRDPATGQIVCRSTLNPNARAFGDVLGRQTDAASWGETLRGTTCVPVNIFGENTVSPEARAYINGTAESSAEIQQHVFSAFVSGDSSQAFELPAGPVGFVLGAEYRKEESLFTPSDIERRGAELGYDLTWLGQGSITEGEFDVYELYGELAVPVLRDLPFAQSVDVSLAYRFSDYSTISTTDTWNIGGQWRISDDLMLRASRARAVRAPNIQELYTPQLQTFASITDPCETENVEAGTEFRLANCTAALGFNPLQQEFIDTTSSSVEGRVGGNPDLRAEKGDTETYGFVLTPRFVPGLSISLDYYKIKLTDAVNLFRANAILESCYDLEQPNEFCGLFTRNEQNFVDSFNEFYVNVSQYDTSGYDLAVRYNLDPARFGIQRDIGQFQLSLIGNKLESLEFTEVAGADPSSELGYVGAPEWSANFDLAWTYNNWLVNYGFNWHSETKRFTDERRESSPNYVPAGYWNYSEKATHDLQVQYSHDDGYSFYAGVNNFTNQEPDRGSSGVSTTGAGTFTGGSTPVGPLGRFFYVGLKARFN